jgi:hypothetical protein
VVAPLQDTIRPVALGEERTAQAKAGRADRLVAELAGGIDHRVEFIHGLPLKARIDTLDKLATPELGDHRPAAGPLVLMQRDHATAGITTECYLELTG